MRSKEIESSVQLKRNLVGRGERATRRVLRPPGKEICGELCFWAGLGEMVLRVIHRVWVLGSGERGVVGKGWFDSIDDIYRYTDR